MSISRHQHCHPATEYIGKDILISGGTGVGKTTEIREEVFGLGRSHP